MHSSSPTAFLLVDGYNIIGAWSCLKKTRDGNSLEASRWQLVEALVNYSAFQGFETQVVFDSQYQNTCRNQEAITPYLSVYYTDFGQTADTYIEKACASRLYLHPQSRSRRLIVATSDRTQQLMILGYGAEWMSAQQLNSEVEFIALRAQRKYKSKHKPATRFLANSLDAKSQQRLSELRKGLY